ncbi:MAG TPA: TetR/AcrR family transcriptional regulator [Pseudonocardia sp.]|nr:TetR/AcrR family transcriptional regulator [Pseudonocardia sp.]
MASPGTRRIRLDAQDRKDQILVAAQRLFAERAYEAVSTTDLAAAAGTTRTNLHYYFGTKRGLYLDVLRRFGRLPELPATGRATGAVEVERLFARWLDVIEENRETFVTMVGAAGPRADPDVEQVLREGMRAWEDRLLAVLELPPSAANRAHIRAFQGLVTSATDEWLRRGTLTKSDVHRLLTCTLLAIGGQVAG